MRWRRFGVSLSIVFVFGSILGCTDPALEKANAEKSKKRILTPGPDDPDAPQEFTTLESGVKYRIRRKSNGKKISAEGNNLGLLYRAWLDDDTIVDSCYGRSGSVRTIDSRHMFTCWKETVNLIGEGGMIEVISPGKFAEADWSSKVGPDGTIHFLIELVNVTDLPEPPPEAPKYTGPKVEVGPADPDAPEEFTTTSSGLQYRIRRKATGKLPQDKVLVHYRGWLDDGTEFDNSYDRGKPDEIDLTGQLIPGWIEGLPLVGEGGMIELKIPPEMGYAEKGVPPKIPPNATLHFLVELLKVK